jgi:energy-coupling factor transport system ATP-binding protein
MNSVNNFAPKNEKIILKDVTFSYTKSHPVLKNINIQINAGTFLGIIGANGSGKSTFLHLLNGLIPHLITGNLTGEVLVNGISTREKNSSFFAHCVGMLFQNPDFSLFNLTVQDEIEFGLKNLKIDFDDEKIIQALEQVNLFNFEKRDPQSLSLGEKQKVCLAAVLAVNPDFFVLDEPIAMLDYQSSSEIYNIFCKLNQLGKTIIAVEHDTDFLWQYAKEILVFDKGKVIAYGDKKEILADKKLLSSLGMKIPFHIPNICED